MPKVMLKFDGAVLDECEIGEHGVTVGRLPDNMIIVDNPAVSGHHARVYMEGDTAILEDLKSTNGTFVRDRPVARHVLAHGDVALIGKHTLEYDALSTAPGVAKREREATVKIADAAVKTERAPAPLPKSATLRLLAGRTDRPEYTLTAHTSLIGKSPSAVIRLHGWFKPKAAAAIARKGDDYTVTPLSGKATINGQQLSSRTDLKDGDVIQVSGVTLEFRLKS